MQRKKILRNKYGPIRHFQKKEKGKREPQKEEKKVQSKKEEIKPEIPKQKKGTSKDAYRVLLSPQITEKATRLTEEDNKYVFKIWSDTTKGALKRVIEQIYGVDVVDVNIVNIPRKQRRLGRHTGWKKGYKKAIVKIKTGQKIEILPR